MQRTDLVVHERNQRRDNHRHTMACVLPGNRGDLVAQRLTAAGGHQHQSVTAFQDMVDDGGLRATKFGVAKNAAQDVEWRQLIYQLGQFMFA